MRCSPREDIGTTCGGGHGSGATPSTSVPATTVTSATLPAKRNVRSKRDAFDLAIQQDTRSPSVALALCHGKWANVVVVFGVSIGSALEQKGNDATVSSFDGIVERAPSAIVYRLHAGSSFDDGLARLEVTHKGGEHEGCPAMDILCGGEITC